MKNISGVFMNNKFVWLCIMLITATGLFFAACGGDPYKDMKLIVEQTSIEITLQDETLDSTTPEGGETTGGGEEAEGGETAQDPAEGTEEDNAETAIPNIGYITAYIENKNDKQSKRILFDVVDKSVARVDNTLSSVEDGKYTVAIRALKAGSTYVTVMSLEGNRVERVKLTVIEPVTGMAFDPNLFVAVAVGESYKFDTSALNYEPITTNQKDVTFTLETPQEGVTITPEGLLEVSSQPVANRVVVVAQSTANAELTSTIEVYIYTKISAEAIHIKSVVDDSEVIDKITIGKNSNFNNINLRIDIDGGSEEYIAYPKVSDVSAIKVDRAQGVENSNLEFKVTGIEQSTVTLTFDVGIVGFNIQSYISKTITVEILDLIDTIYVNGSSRNATVTVFDKYTAGSEVELGTKILIEIAPKNASVKSLTFSATEEDTEKLAKFDFSTSTGQAIPNILEYEMVHSGAIYAKLKPAEAANFGEFECSLVVEANKHFSEEAVVTNKVKISVKKGISTLAFEREGDDVYIDLANDDYQEFNYYVNGSLVNESSIAGALSGFDLSANKVMVQKANILAAKIVGGRLFIKPLAVGETSISLRTPNGVSATTQIKVVVPTQDVTIDVDKIANKDVIASIERDDDNVLTKINANANSMFDLNVVKTNTNGTIWDLQFTSTSPNVASVSNNGVVRVLYAGTTTIRVSYSYTRYDEISGAIVKADGQQEIELFAFRPITMFDIGKQGSSAYDVNSVGYFEVKEYSTVSFEVAMNDCYIKKSSIRMYIRGETFDLENSANSYTIVGRNGTLVYEGNGVATFYAKLSSDSYSSAEAQIVAVVSEFDRTYTSVCTVKILKASQTVEDILLYNVDSYLNPQDNQNYYAINFKKGLGVGANTDNNMQIVASALPKNALNSKLYYFAFDDPNGNTRLTTSTHESSVIKVTQDGVVYPLKAGQAKIIIVPRDKLTRFDNNGDFLLSANEALENLVWLQTNGSSKWFKEITVKVADGTIDNPYVISNVQDFLSIKTGMSDHYVLAKSIDLSMVDLSSIALLETPFTGSINGRYYITKPNAEKPNGVYIDSKIFGIRLQLANAEITDETQRSFGLFRTVQSAVSADNSEVYPSFSNITIEFLNVNVTCRDVGNSSGNLNFGLLAGSFSGEMENVSVILRGSVNVGVTSAFGRLNFGVFAGQMSELVHSYLNQVGEGESKTFASTLSGCKLYGNGAITLNASCQNVNAGGYVGLAKNNTHIVGKYAFTNDASSAAQGFIYSFNEQENDCQVNLTVNIENATETAVGGVVGYNLGSIEKMAVSGRVLAENANNVGGIAGESYATISDVYSAIVVVGADNVGGLVGHLNGTNAKLILAINESYEDGNSYVKGNSAVGGAVGKMSSATMSYVSSSSFVTTINQYSVIANVSGGGLVGVISGGSIEKSFANTKVAVNQASYIQGAKYAGGFVGQFLGGQVTNSYSITDLYAINSGVTATLGGFVGYASTSSSRLTFCYSVSNQKMFAGLSAGGLIGQASYYASTSPDGNGGNVGAILAKSVADLKNESTYSGWNFISIFNMKADGTVNQGFPYLMYSNSEFITIAPTQMVATVKNTRTNEFVKAGDKRAVLLIQKEVSSAANDYYEYAIADLVELQVSPLTNRIVRVKADVVEGGNILRIEGGTIVVMGEGYAKIRITSQLNENVFDEIEVYTTYGLNSFAGADLENGLRLLLDTSKEINYTFENGNNIVGEKFGVAYKNMFTYTTFNYAEIEPIATVDHSFVDYNFSKIINATAVTDAENTIIQCAYINAKFGTDFVKVLLPWTETQFNVSVYNGATDLRLNQNQTTIYPNQSTQIVANVTTDLNTEIVSKVVVRDGDEIVDTFTLEIGEAQTPSVNSITITPESDAPRFDLDLITFEFTGVELSMTFEIQPTSELYALETSKTYQFSFEVLDKFAKQFNLILLPQNIERVTMLHFPDGNLREDEVAVDRISSGISGLMKINVYPSFSQVDYIELTSEKVMGENITFIQYYESGGDLVRLYPENMQIENGIRLKLITYRTIDGYAFDGNIYVSTLIKSDMPEDLPFNVQITAYKDNEPVYTYEKALYTQFSPSVTIDYSSMYADQIARGVTLDIPLKLNTMQGTVTLSVEDYEGDSTFISFTLNNSTFNSKFVGEVTAQLFASVNLDAGTRFKIKAQLDTIVENVRVTVTDERVITVVDYIITGVSIEDATVDTSGNNKLTIYLSRATNLKAKVKSIYAPLPDGVDANSIEGRKYTEIAKKISNFEAEITKQNGRTDASVWFTGKTSGGIENVGSFDSDSGENDYYSYYYSNTDTDKCYKIYGKKIGSVAIVSLYVAYYFDGTASDFKPHIVDLTKTLPEGKTIYYKQFDCVISVENESTEEIPLPVYTAEEFIGMQTGVHYILMRDIELNAYTPINADFASLDGNGYIVKVKSFSVSSDETTANIGLFGTVSANTVIKNVVLDVNYLLNGGDSTNTFDLTSKGQVNFGLFVGQNAGIITNCDVINVTELISDSGQIADGGRNKTLTVKTSLISGSSYTTNYIGLFAGQNSGNITNSRVGRVDANIGVRENVNDKTPKNNSWTGAGIDLVANGVVAGFAAYNANAISACYVKGIAINNNSVIANVSYTAGFVAVNDGGYISGSYGEGAQIETSDKANLKSQGSVAGFVLTNAGTVSNCYADFVIRSPSNSAGFVNTNSKKAVVEYCYTTSKVYLAGGLIGDNASFRPFTGVNDFNEIQNEGSVVYSYYTKATDATVFADEPALAINEEDAAKQSEYVGFAFVENEKLRSYGIWQFDTAQSRPVLTAANQVAVSMRQLKFDADSQQDAIDKSQDDNGILIYSYQNGYELGSEINPYLINTAEKFNNLFKGVETFGSNIVSATNATAGAPEAGAELPETKFIRIISTLNFAATSETVDGLNSSKVVFSAVLDGNNMLLSGISLSGEKTTGQNEFGLFKQLDGALVKNLRLQFSEVTATEIPVVGGLAGFAKDSIILGVKVTGEGSFVQGKNVVGGLVGIANGSCEIQTIESNISTRATYRRGSGAVQFVDLTFETDENIVTIEYANTSYAGGIIGAVLAAENDAMVVRTLKVYGAVSIGAERTGGVVAANYGKLYDISFIVRISSDSKKQELSGDDSIGGLVGVNFGSLEKARLTYEGDDLEVVDKLDEGVIGGKTNLFIGASNYVGGLVGKNIGGKIIDSYNRVDVSNSNSEYAGGLAGYVKGGEFSSAYTTSNVYAKTAFGSAFGYLDKDVTIRTINNIKREVVSTISQFNNIVLLNNYSTSVAQSVKNGASAGVLAGYVNAEYITDVFSPITISSNYAVYNLPLNTSGTSYQKLNYFGSIKFDKMKIDQEEYNQLFSHFNAFTAVKDSGSTQFTWFNTAEVYTHATYRTLFKNRYDAFNTYDDDDWTKETSTFPLLKITTQASEIVITDDNKADLITLIDNNPNATFVIKCDIKMYTAANLGDLTGDWVSLGTKISPFSGKFLGQQIKALEGGKIVERLPIIELNRTLIDYCRSATVSNLTIRVNIPNQSDRYQNEIDNFYFGSIANYAENSSFSGLTIEGISPIAVSGNRTYNDSEEVPSNYVGGLIGYASGSVISDVSFASTVQVELQTATQTIIKSHVGGIVGYCDKTDILDVDYNVSYTQYTDKKVYKHFGVTSGNASVGTIAGSAKSSKLKSITLSETKVATLAAEAPLGSAFAPVSSAVNARNARTSLTFGGVVGYLNNTTLSGINNELSNLKLTSNVKELKTITAGAIVGETFSSTILIANNLSNIAFTNETPNDTYENEFVVGGFIGLNRGTTQIASAQNFGSVSVSGTTMTQSTAYVGGLIGEVSCGTTVSKLTTSRNVGSVTVLGVYNSNVGGLVGRVAAEASSADLNGNFIINECYSESSVTTKSNRAKEEVVGGLVGFANRISVENSYSVGRTTSQTTQVDAEGAITVGGFIGRLHQANVQPKLAYCYSANIVKVYADVLKTKVYSKEFVGYTSLTSQNIDKVVFASCYYVGEFAQANDVLKEGYTQSMHDYSANFVSYSAMLHALTFKNFSISTDIADTSKTFVMTEGNTLPMLTKFVETTSSAAGSVYQPRQIASADDLRAFTTNTQTGADEYYVQTKNITAPQAETRANFSGVFDGGSYTIDGLTKPLFGKLGTDAVVAAVNIQGFSLSATSSGDYGTLARVNHGSILFVSADGTISFTSSCTDSTFGGLVGTNYGYIGFSSSDVDVSQTDRNSCQKIAVGGIVGRMLKETQDKREYSQISNSFASGTLTLWQITGENLSTVGGLVGNLEGGNLQLCYSAARVNYLNSSSVKAYGAVFSNDSQGDQVNNIYDEIGISLVYNDKLATLLDTLDTKVIDVTMENVMTSGLFGGFDPYVWSSFKIDYDKNSKSTLLNYGYPYLRFANNTVAQIANKGTGATKTPYLIKNQSAFELINALESKNLKYTYKLDRDIYCTNGDFIDKLQGTLDGGNYFIYNLNMTISSGSQNGFINNNSGTVSNINFVDSTITISKDFVGTAVGLVIGYNSGKVNSVNVQNAQIIFETTTSSASTSVEMSIGGFVGENAGKITTSSVKTMSMRLRNTHLNGLANLGGFVGKNSGTIGESGKTINTTVDGIVINAGGSTKIDSKVYKRVGGFVGYVSGGAITNCQAIGGSASRIAVEVSGDDNKIGGFAGQNGSASVQNTIPSIVSCLVNVPVVVDVNSGAKLDIGNICGYTQWIIRSPVVYKNISISGSTTYVNTLDDYVGSMGGKTGLVVSGTVRG